MGKGDKKSKKGKRFQHSFGKTRARKKGKTISSRKKVEVKTKPIEHKKPTKPEPELVKPVVVEPKAEEIAIKEPEIKEIKEEVKPTEVIESPATEVPEITPEPVKEVVELPEIKETAVPEIKPEPIKEEIVKEDKAKVEAPKEAAPKKRGRPKKKKDE
jgi:ribosomal small subunit protein bTHX